MKRQTMKILIFLIPNKAFNFQYMQFLLYDIHQCTGDQAKLKSL